LYETASKLKEEGWGRVYAPSITDFRRPGRRGGGREGVRVSLLSPLPSLYNASPPNPLEVRISNNTKFINYSLRFFCFFWEFKIFPTSWFNSSSSRVVVYTSNHFPQCSYTVSNIIDTRIRWFFPRSFLTYKLPAGPRNTSTDVAPSSSLTYYVGVQTPKKMPRRMSSSVIHYVGGFAGQILCANRHPRTYQKPARKRHSPDPWAAPTDTFF